MAEKLLLRGQTNGESSLYFSLITGIHSETGSRWTASTAINLF